MWSVHDLSWQKPACSSRSLLSRAAISRSKIILVNTLPGIDSSMIPLQLLQDDISPFFGSFTICPFFQSSGTCSCSHTLFRSGYNISVNVWVSALSASGGIPSGPAVLPVLRDLMALEISILDWGFGVYAKEFGRRWDSWRGLRCGSVKCFLEMFSPSSSLVPFAWE